MNGFPHLANLIRELELNDERTRREAERESALAAEAKDYKLSPESRAALERGDRQRLTGAYEGHAATFFDWDDEDERQYDITKHTHECNTREDDVCDSRGFCRCDCGRRRFWSRENSNEFAKGGRWVV